MKKFLLVCGIAIFGILQLTAAAVPEQSDIAVLERASRAAYDSLANVGGQALGRGKDTDCIKSANTEHYFSVYLFCHYFSSPLWSCVSQQRLDRR